MAKDVHFGYRQEAASFRLNAGDARNETVEGAELYFGAAVFG